MTNPISATSPLSLTSTTVNPFPSLPDGKPGARFELTSSAGVNPACGKVLLRKTLVRAIRAVSVDLP